MQANENPPHEMTGEQLNVHLIGAVMAKQYSTKKAKELFEDKADAALMRELNQIHDFETFKPIHASDFPCERKKKVLESLVFVTEKVNANIKACKVSYGSKKRTYL